MIEVYVRGHDVAQLLRRDAAARQGLQDGGQVERGAGLDQRCLTVVDDQVAGREAGAVVTRVDAGDAMGQCFDQRLPASGNLLPQRLARERRAAPAIVRLLLRGDLAC
jgi:hypothetical protein